MDTGNRIRKIVVAGVFSALVIVLGVTGLGFIPLPLGAITILQVPVIIGAILEGPVVGICIGLLFGIFSIVQAAIAGVTPVDLAFLHYPWIAIVPRILIGPVSWLVYSLIAGTLFKGGGIAEKTKGGTDGGTVEPQWHREAVSVIFGAAFGSLINTVLVLSAFALFLEEIGWQIVFSLALLNGPVEAGFSAGISLAVILAWRGISRRGKSRLNSA
jgi:uncharacterized membrane protein